ncbi:hypothetical protein BC936DRAFT_140906 [Jimgerdemannia flammicorona]|uniref:Uncharacterized protein n=2 Tax=Jimgerdemannia flammicorona TaxID=994334 RepID=A0A433Q2U2_9FUNG|nr:hypothetical protein BC936DRAFT_140906 [Jimgerdemannia flammicorona]RUS24131.1 hypothetical protein BC938DRAFT_474064 [Jimgerdemannia flammicorona]
MNTPQHNTRIGSPGPQSSNEPQAVHLLSLKVMRLSRPSLATTNPVYYETSTSSVLFDALESLNISDLVAVHQLPTGTSDPSRDLKIRDFGLSEVLTLPSAFGNIYLGETFSSYLCINNEAAVPVREVGVKAELQTGSQRFNLTDTTSRPLATMDKGSTCEFVVSHEIKELGVHILVCSVHYVTADGEKKYFRKYYKFQVMNPLAVKTKVNNMTDGRVFLEAQVQNVANSPMFLERMRFEPAEHFAFRDLNFIIGPSTGYTTAATTGAATTTTATTTATTTTTSPTAPSVFGAHNYLNPQDIRQYLYLLTPKKLLDDRLARTTNALGKLDIIWRSTLGETGRLQTSQLTRKPPLLEDIEVLPAHVPSVILLETPFAVTLRVRNRTARAMKLVLSAVKTKMGSVLLSGTSIKQLGEVAAEGVVEVRLEFFPLTPGLQRIGGLKVADQLSGYSKEVEHLCDVFVVFGEGGEVGR